MSGHTPGPWQICTDRISPPEIIAPGVFDICTMSGASSNESVMADARLIAAAPEMLEILIYARSMLPHEKWADDIKTMIEAVIAKATNQQGNNHD